MVMGNEQQVHGWMGLFRDIGLINHALSGVKR